MSTNEWVIQQEVVSNQETISSEQKIELDITYCNIQKFLGSSSTHVLQTHYIKDKQDDSYSRTLYYCLYCHQTFTPDQALTIKLAS